MNLLFLLRCRPFQYHYSYFLRHFLDLNTTGILSQKLVGYMKRAGPTDFADRDGADMPGRRLTFIVPPPPIPLLAPPLPTCGPVPRRFDVPRRSGTCLRPSFPTSTSLYTSTFSYLLPVILLSFCPFIAFVLLSFHPFTQAFYCLFSGQNCL